MWGHVFWGLFFPIDSFFGLLPGFPPPVVCFMSPVGRGDLKKRIVMVWIV